MFIAALLFALGLFLVIKGGDWFVDSSVEISKLSGLPQIFIGSTIVSIATTLPETLVSLSASMINHGSISIGNAVGSVICNIGLIMGIVLTFSITRLRGRIFKAKLVIMMLYMFIIIFLSLDKVLSSFDAVILILMLIIYLIVDITILRYKQAQKQSLATSDKQIKSKSYITFRFLIGISCIIIGSKLLISNGIKLSMLMGVPESVIALSFIALGTSLPEFAAAITALRKGYTELSIGNIVGANILNLTLVLGSSCVFSNLTVNAQNLYMDYPVALILIFLLSLPMIIKKKTNRLQGIAILLIYVLYIFTMYYIYI